MFVNVFDIIILKHGASSLKSNLRTFFKIRKVLTLTFFTDLKMKTT